MKVDIADRIASHFPIGEPPVQLALVAGATGEWITDDAPAAMATVRLIVWDVGPETTSIRDIKEQELHMGFPALYDDDDRVAAFFAALATVLADIAKDLDVIGGLMPHDLVRADVLKLKRARTREDFETALRARSRLGAYL